MASTKNIRFKIGSEDGLFCIWNIAGLVLFECLCVFLCSQFLMQYVRKQKVDLPVHVPLALIVLTSTYSCTAEEHIHGGVGTLVKVYSRKKIEKISRRCGKSLIIIRE